MSAKDGNAYRLAKRLKEEKRLNSGQANECYQALRDAMRRQAEGGPMINLELIVEDICANAFVRDAPKLLRVILGDPKEKYLVWDSHESDASEEMAQDDELKRSVEQEGNEYDILLAEMAGKEPPSWRRHEWLEPNFPLDDFGERDRGFLIAHPEYRENTFISVWRESKAKGVPMREICEAKGLIPGCLIC